MRIELNNIAAMRRAEVEIDGITVIAGENNTGKSTVSKALWCMFDSFYKYEEQFDSFRADALSNDVRKWCEISDVTNSTSRIFDRLVSPFDRLEAEAARI